MLNNQWSDVYDFTPGGDGARLSPAPCNHHLVLDGAKPSKTKYQYKLLPPTANHHALLGGTSEDVLMRLREALGADLSLHESSPTERRVGVLPSCGLEECYRFAAALTLGQQPVCFHAFVVAPLALGDALRDRVWRWLGADGTAVVKSRVKPLAAEQWAQVEALLDKHLPAFKAVPAKQRKKLAGVMLHEPVVVLHLMAREAAQLEALAALLAENAIDGDETRRSEFNQYGNYVSAMHPGELAVLPASAAETRKDVVSELAHHMFHIWKEKDSH